MSPRRRHASAALALALVSAACSGSIKGEGAAPGPSTTTAPGSLHDPLPTADAASGENPPLTPPGGGPAGSTTTARRGGGGTTSTTASTGGKATTTTAATLPPGLPPEKCPEPKTCRRYRFHGDGQAHPWRAGQDGLVRIPYRINPSGSTTLTPEQIEGAFRAAFDAWQRAAPALRFVYEGRTTMQAAPGDGVNVIAFNGPTIENTTPTLDQAGFMVEFDMLYTANGWAWAPCEQRDGSCTPISGNTTGPVTNTPRDLQSIATHAVGHALWIGDSDDQELDRYLTMYPGMMVHPPGSRFWSTLALGDVLAVRALYPCSCPLPPIYDP